MAGDSWKKALGQSAREDLEKASQTLRESRDLGNKEIATGQKQQKTDPYQSPYNENANVQGQNVTSSQMTDETRNVNNPNNLNSRHQQSSFLKQWEAQNEAKKQAEQASAKEPKKPDDPVQGG